MAAAVQESVSDERRRWRWLRSDLPTPMHASDGASVVPVEPPRRTHASKNPPPPPSTGPGARERSAAEESFRREEGRLRSLPVVGWRRPGILAVARGFGAAGIQIELAIWSCDVGWLAAELQ
jgi:hypothetical protein